MMVIGQMINNKVKELKYGLMELNMKDNIIRGEKMEKGEFNLQMDLSMKENLQKMQ